MVYHTGKFIDKFIPRVFLALFSCVREALAGKTGKDDLNGTSVGPPYLVGDVLDSGGACLFLGEVERIRKCGKMRLCRMGIHLRERNYLITCPLHSETVPSRTGEETDGLGWSLLGLDGSAHFHGHDGYKVVV
jgi:hypothetical protein